MTNTRYVKPRWATKLLNQAVVLLARSGVSVWGARMLYVRGRKTGQWHATPVNVLTYGGERYLVAPRGHTHWVRNLRATGEGELRLGRRIERFTRPNWPMRTSLPCSAPTYSTGNSRSAASLPVSDQRQPMNNCCASPPATRFFGLPAGHGNSWDR